MLVAVADTASAARNNNAGETTASHSATRLSLFSMRRAAFAALLTDRHYFGASQFDGSLAYRQSVGGLGATPDFYPNGPTYRFRMAVLDANLSVPFQVASQPLHRARLRR
ncbi:hypothetical protein CI15_19565 [Paraburkholderia monticola]|uniref:Haemolysin activator HlyB C-terminal domain-containing protein n=1 Tax=Paraburkholderia monticola TaxID=1399968 RepID=A0A149PK21_9BURK|nr:hypothetical protein CI15_19565 [Paraburkholderia monticola]